MSDKWKPSVTTRRQMIGLTAWVFDPTGFFCPFVLKGKLLFQEATNLSQDWDDPLPENIRKAFDEWQRELPELQNIQIPRWVATPETTGREKELHTFCDASEDGYGCSTYEQTIAPDATVHVALLDAKASVVPKEMKRQALKDQECHNGSIPRLELNAARLGAERCETMEYSSPSKYRTNQ
jgi:hypothetical protein